MFKVISKNTRMTSFNAARWMDTESKLESDKTFIWRRCGYQKKALICINVRLYVHFVISLLIIGNKFLFVKTTLCELFPSNIRNMLCATSKVFKYRKIQSEYRKISTRNNFVFGHFLRRDNWVNNSIESSRLFELVPFYHIKPLRFTIEYYFQIVWLLDCPTQQCYGLLL